MEQVNVACPHCGREYKLAVSLDSLARVRKQARCSRCGKRFDIAEQLGIGAEATPPALQAEDASLDFSANDEPTTEGIVEPSAAVIEPGADEAQPSPSAQRSDAVARALDSLVMLRPPRPLADSGDPDHGDAASAAVVKGALDGILGFRWRDGG